MGIFDGLGTLFQSLMGTTPNIAGSATSAIKPLATTQSGLNLPTINSTGMPLFKPDAALTNSVMGKVPTNTTQPTGSQTGLNPKTIGNSLFSMDNLFKLGALGLGYYNDKEDRKRTDFALKNNARTMQNTREKNKHLGASVYGGDYSQPGKDYDTTI